LTLKQAATSGAEEGCITKKFHSCNCTLDTTLTPNVQDVIDGFQKLTGGYWGISGIWNNGISEMADIDPDFGREGFMKFECEPSSFVVAG